MSAILLHKGFPKITHSVTAISGVEQKTTSSVLVWLTGILQRHHNRCSNQAKEKRLNEISKAVKNAHSPRHGRLSSDEKTTLAV